MNPQKLYLENKKFSGVYFCSKCKCVSSKLEEAEKCCRPYHCKECGKLTNTYITTCGVCSIRIREKELKRKWEKAKKININDYDGECIYCENNDRYIFLEHFDVKEETEDVDDEFIRLFATTKSKFNLDADDIINGELENHHEDADISSNGYKEMREFLKIWCDKYGVETYYPDYSLAIIIP